tara:strand:+ start:5662 stop:5985 length:324 start_codon:yes stop_codon:yes gene_type:complete
MALDRKRGRGLTRSPGSYENQEYPDRLKKDGCIYLNGVVTFSSRGVYKVLMDNDMEAICTASKMDHKRVGILPGDNVSVEIPAVSLSPGCAVKGRIVWRIRPAKKTE